MREIDFFKYQGTGNDFVIIDEIDTPLGITSDDVRWICDRHFGIGADGVILARPSDGADFKMVFFNPDGTEAEMCGNGIRCYASFLLLNKRTDKKEIRLETASGYKVVTLTVEVGQVESANVEMGKPNLISKMIPVNTESEEFIDLPLDIDSIDHKGTCISMGNPHCVVFVDDLDAVSIEQDGPLIEKASIFPNGTNVEFTKVVSRNEIELVVWERGAGVTLSCGTGACAAVVAAVKNGLTDRRVSVTLPGGKLNIYWSESGCVYLSGPAREVFSGRLVTNPQTI